MKVNQTPRNSQISINPLKVRSSCSYPVKKVVNMTLDLPSNYTLVEKVGQGSFGEIYKLYDNLTNTLHACKVETKDRNSNAQHQPLLAREFKVLQALSTIASVPQAFHFISTTDYNLFIMPYFGSGNLEELRKKVKTGALSKKSTMLLGHALVDSLDKVHELKYIHRDIKPENFIVGSTGDQHKVYLIDYGLAKPFIDHQGNHIPMATNKGMVGTARYTSINSHTGLEQSRRDDLEAVGYVLMYLHLGQLPWQNFNCQTRQEKFQKILEQKVVPFYSVQVKFSSNQLVIDCPQELKKYFDYIKTLQFDQKPDYNYLKTLFSNSLQRINDEQGNKRPCCYDWCPHDCTINQGESEQCDIISNEVPSQYRTGTTKQTTHCTDNTGSHAQKIEKNKALMNEPHYQFGNILENKKEEEQSENKSYKVPDEQVHIQQIVYKMPNRGKQQQI